MAVISNYYWFIDFVTYSGMAWWLYEVDRGNASKNPFIRAAFWFALFWIGSRLLRSEDAGLPDFVSYSWIGWWLHEVELGTLSKNQFLRCSFWFALSWVGLRLSS